MAAVYQSLMLRGEILSFFFFVCVCGFVWEVACHTHRFRYRTCEEFLSLKRGLFPSDAQVEGGYLVGDPAAPV